ncbi:hypothetical protein [Ralstonia phage RP13]|nr:hypothetical protein [Ralstonia phage RP13]
MKLVIESDRPIKTLHIEFADEESVVHTSVVNNTTLPIIAPSPGQSYGVTQPTAPTLEEHIERSAPVVRLDTGAAVSAETTLATIEPTGDRKPMVDESFTNTQF